MAAVLGVSLKSRKLPLAYSVSADDYFGCVVLAIILTDEATSRLKLLPILDALQEIKPTKSVIFASLDEGAEIDSTYSERFRQLGVPFFPSTERALRALARVTAYANRAHSSYAPSSEPARLTESLEPGPIPEYRTKQFLRSTGISVPVGSLAKSVDEARTIAANIGFPVALKAQAPSLSHKSDAGGVALNLRNVNAVSDAWQRIQIDLAQALPELDLDGMLVEKMGKTGSEIIVGARNDPEWGPVVLVGCGGVLAEAINDVRLMVPEMDKAAIISELMQLKGAQLLKGFRGSPPLDVDAVADIVSIIGQLITSRPDIQEIEINPVVVYPIGHGAMALDALMLVR